MPDARAPRPTAVRFGLATSASLAALYAVGSLWTPIPNLLVAIVYISVFVGLLRGSAWAGYGGALVLMVSVAGAISGELRLGGPLATLVSLATLLGCAGAFAFLLFRAGRALPAAATAARPVWLAVAAALLLFSSTMKPFVVPTAAMEDTILTGDQLYVRVAGPYTPARGDVVALRYPPDPQQTFIKRVVAVGGDRLRFHDKTLILNGAPQNEPYATHKTPYLDAFRDNFPAAPTTPLIRDWAGQLPAHIVNGDLVVPSGKYFVLGDNRDNSLDSRYWGFVDRAAIIGRPAFIYFSADRLTEDLSAQQLATPILFTPGKIRWSRLFHTLR